MLKIFKKKRYVHLVANPFTGSLPSAIVVEESNQLMTFNANTNASKLFLVNIDREHYMKTENFLDYGSIPVFKVVFGPLFSSDCSNDS